MTTHSINVPDAWQIHTAKGRYEETMFEFQFESPASTALSVRLVGQSSTEHDAIYTIRVVMDDGKEQSLIAGECTSEAEAMKRIKELLRSLQQSFGAEARTLDELDAETVETIVGRYRYGRLRYRPSDP
jgi:hypothetical protein